MNEKDLNTWKRLYEAANLLKVQKPWELIDDYDFVTIELKGRKEAVYCRVLGELERAYMINVFESSDALFDAIYEMEHDEIPWHQNSRYINCLSVVYSDREILIPEDRKMIDLLGLKYRGRKAWPLFRSYEKGYAGTRLNAVEAARLAEVLEQLAPAIADMRAGNLELDIDGEETILRRFNKKTKSWETLVAPLNDEPKHIESFSLTDEIMMSQLKRIKKLQKVVEMDVMHHIVSIDNAAIRKRRLARFAMACEVDKPSEPYITSPLEPEDDEISTILNILIGYINEIGRPREIRVRDDIVEIAIQEICSELGIKTSVSESLPAIDAVFEAITGLDEIDED
jgi:hypothetical protein